MAHACALAWFAATDGAISSSDEERTSDLLGSVLNLGNRELSAARTAWERSQLSRVVTSPPRSPTAGGSAARAAMKRETASQSTPRAPVSRPIARKRREPSPEAAKPTASAFTGSAGWAFLALRRLPPFSCAAFQAGCQLRPGDDVDALDTASVWMKGTILEREGRRVLVHYFGWPSRWDEWIDVQSARLAPRFSRAPEESEHKRMSLANGSRRKKQRRC